MVADLGDVNQGNCDSDASLGLIMMAAKGLPGPAAKVIGSPIFIGLTLIALVTIIQAEAIWSTPTGWALAGVLLVGCVGAQRLVRLGDA